MKMRMKINKGFDEGGWYFASLVGNAKKSRHQKDVVENSQF
jgi:hypothetical protein